ncbi:lactate dehydrogenase [Microcoleus sp. AT8-B4]|uniref:DNA methyltransferase n=1 Tax=Microcoleus sp. AT8-B4 TaxID=2818620 RepID=UPI002FD65219
MNAVEIEEAVSRLAEAPFDSEEFPFAFLEAFGNKPTTLKRLKSKSGGSNQSDLGGLLQRNNIHVKVCPEGEVTNTLTALRDSAATARYKVKFILATDGKSFEAENLADGEIVACDYPDFHNHFGFFLPLAGITTVKQIRENAFDIKATGRLNRLYVELLKENPEWDKADRREALNHFMARLIFCFFAEDTNIFHSNALFTATIEQMSASDSSNTHEVLSEMFRAMCTPLKDREAAKIRNWADRFPYVNGGLFSGGVAVPRFSKIARSYLLHVGNLDWTKINPDIFGSMIQAVADDEERGALGMHYTSVPNILKVLNPLFLDDLREQLEAAGDNARKLLNLRQRMARIRVFDPACGSGNFLVIAYKKMREIEAEINRLRGEPDRKSEIPLTNFRGIELRHFSCEIARLALIIAEYQCDVMYRGPKLALAEFLPLKDDNWITCGNALRLDWLSLCPPTGAGVKVQREDLDLFGETREVAEIDFENEGGETYICGNPPYLGSTWQSKEQKDDLKLIFDGRTKLWKSLDYVSGWFMKAADYGTQTTSAAAFVSTNSICQGQQVPILWTLIFETGHEIAFAHTSFKWANLASHNAGVTVVIVGISNNANKVRYLISIEENGETVAKEATNINAYLVAGSNIIVDKQSLPHSPLPKMIFGNKVVDGGHLRMSSQEVEKLGLPESSRLKFVRRIVGSSDFIKGELVYCLWIYSKELEEAMSYTTIATRVEAVRFLRLASSDKSANQMAERAYQFREMREASSHTIVLPRITSENREFLPVGLIDHLSVVSSQSFALFDEPLWLVAILASRLHLSWIATVCGRTRTDFAYSNTLGWNTFPVPTLTDQNKADLTRCAEDILLAREHYFPATIADMYDRDRMDTEFPLVREAHDRNDEILERIYIGRRFKNDTERLEKLFELYTKMTTQQTPQKKSAKRKI